MSRAIDADRLLDALNSIVLDYTSEGKYPDGFGIDDAINLVEGAPTLTSPNEWISVDERLPDEELNQIKRLFPGENEVEVLVMIEGAYIATTLYWDGEKFYDETSTYEVTHWMPLPKSPKEDE